MPFLLTFLLLFGFWLLLSGQFDLFHLTLGVISSALVAFLSGDLLVQDRAKKGRLAEAGRFIAYIPWLLKEIVVANLYVAYLALHPRMKDLLDPTVVTFKTRLQQDISRVALANSITLTPGTITIRIVDDHFYVHALNRKIAAGMPGEMEDRLKAVFERT
jgi:multicomponent Na+:H+ antiporter subunit E